MRKLQEEHEKFGLDNTSVPGAFFCRRRKINIVVGQGNGLASSKFDISGLFRQHRHALEMTPHRQPRELHSDAVSYPLSFSHFYVIIIDVTFRRNRIFFPQQKMAERKWLSTIIMPLVCISSGHSRVGTGRDNPGTFPFHHVSRSKRLGSVFGLSEVFSTNRSERLAKNVKESRTS